jgi:predicted xylose isomerase-like sugar epimerase
VTNPVDDASIRDVDLVDLQLQNAATWNLLENATQIRELTVRLHGGALALAPFVVAVVDGTVALIVASLAAVFLTAVSIATFLNLNAIRLLQFRIGVEEGRARVRLRGGLATYATEVDIRPPRLRTHNDPMGITTRSALALVAFDIVVACAALGLLATVEASSQVRVVTFVAAAALGIGLALLSLSWLVRKSDPAPERIEEGELR